MIRHYYLSDDLDDLARLESELLAKGFSLPQIHVLSENDGAVQRRHLHEVESVLKKDVVHSTEVGAIVGAIGAILVLLCAYFFDWYQSAAGWIPFIFLAIVVLGFCTWEGGFIGIQKPNVEFERFQGLLKQGKHIFFVDIDNEQESELMKVVKKHPNLIIEGKGEGTPGWVVRSQEKFRQFMKTMP
ncbi:NAD/FAD-utilizing enzyme [Thalassotalea mangrovi]|uniref:NAD/FAD-utilizing enzyme n=1 Tax=Thalassotalea mangrovi TaxID=2572245 RepID=A0A4U1B447_9GAMM|nr:NAD/FAD-utilizing enzyme [Thalassotalea mangrovi]TKB44900.1 NAD/FAD-utilizing enzyme [Thalassotalea mangrovi]